MTRQSAKSSSAPPWWDLAIVITLLGAIASGIYRFARLEERLEGVIQDINRLEVGIKECEQGHPAIVQQIEVTKASVEQLRCDIFGQTFDPISNRCHPVPRSPLAGNHILENRP